MVPERLLHDLAETPVVDESELPIDSEDDWLHGGQLTEAEIEIVRFLSHGYTFPMIAEQRGTTRQTIADQVKKARAAMNAKTKEHLVAIALRRGLID